MVTGIKARYRVDKSIIVMTVVRDTCQGADHKRQGCSSKYVGVDFYKSSKKWRANLGVDDIKLFLGYFKTEIEAAQVYNACALYFYGEDAKLNDVPKLEPGEFDISKIVARRNKYIGLE